jgi:hypothetical protein
MTKKNYGSVQCQCGKAELIHFNEKCTKIKYTRCPVCEKHYLSKAIENARKPNKLVRLYKLWFLYFARVIGTELQEY